MGLAYLPSYGKEASVYLTGSYRVVSRRKRLLDLAFNIGAGVASVYAVRGWSRVASVFRSILVALLQKRYPRDALGAKAERNRETSDG